MNQYYRPLEIGRLKLNGNVIYSPLAGCSDYPFRLMSARYSPDLMFCEMVKMQALLRYDEGTFRLLDYAEEMRPIGAQLVGGCIKSAGPAAKICEDLGFDVIDLNCGCPVDKVTKDGGGSGMLKHPEKIGDVLAEIVAAVSLPVTLKVRGGWDDENIIAPEIVRIAEEAGASAIFVHGRTRAQAYRGKANRETIRRCKSQARKIKVIGNGDIFEPEDAVAMMEETGCDGVLVSRGTMGRPWLAEDIRRHCLGGEPLKMNPKDIRQALLDHFELMLAYHSLKRAVIEMRRVGCWYIKSRSGTRAFRHAMARVTSKEEARDLIHSIE